MHGLLQLARSSSGHCVFLVTEDETELNARVTNRKHPKKIHNPNRLSASIPKILWASLRPWVCVEEAKDETKVFLVFHCYDSCLVSLIYVHKQHSPCRLL